MLGTQTLIHTQSQTGMAMSEELVIFICPKCFQILESRNVPHEHDRRLIRCEPGSPVDRRRRPPFRQDGHVMTHAPRWYLEAIGTFPQELS